MKEKHSFSQDPPMFQAADVSSVQDDCLDGQEQDSKSVFFKDDRMYSHCFFRLNYTTYDVRREQDVIHPTSSHRDIVLLATSGDHCTNHQFLYARVLGVYHVNVIYTGAGMLDYRPRRLDFLWVRWFEYVGDKSVSWADCTLDSVRFPPMASEGAFGFVDPDDVLRSCHIVSAFESGQVHSDNVGLSRCADDSHDWRFYHVNRYAHLTKLLHHDLVSITDLLIVIWLCVIIGVWLLDTCIVMIEHPAHLLTRLNLFHAVTVTWGMTWVMVPSRRKPRPKWVHPQ
jgi:hypothetical protein